MKISLLKLILLFILSYSRIYAQVPVQATGTAKDTILLKQINIDLTALKNLQDSLKVEQAKIHATNDEIITKAVQLSSASKVEKLTITSNLGTLFTQKANQSSIQITNIDKAQLDAVKLCMKQNIIYGTGASNVDIILGSLQIGSDFGKLTSPFASTDFTKRYDSWKDKWAKFIPAIVLPIGSLFLKGANAKVAGASTGLLLTSIFNGFSKKNGSEFDKAFTAFNETLDLFEFNRTVYGDLKKLDDVVISALTFDPKLAVDYIELNKETNRLWALGEAAMIADTGYKTYIKKSLPIIDRFQVKLTKISYVFNFASSLISAYKKYDFPDASNEVKTTKEYSTVLNQTSKVVNDLTGALDANKDRWEGLMSNVYILTPKNRRTLERFEDLEDDKISLAMAITQPMITP